MCSFETLLFLISFSVFGEANCMFIRIHYLSVSDITPFFLFSPILQSTHTHKHTIIFFGCCCFYSIQDTKFYLCLSWAYLTIVLLLVQCSLQVTFSVLHATNGDGILFVTFVRHSNIKQQWQQSRQVKCLMRARLWWITAMNLTFLQQICKGECHLLFGLLCYYFQLINV